MYKNENKTFKSQVDSSGTTIWDREAHMQATTRQHIAMLKHLRTLGRFPCEITFVSKNSVLFCAIYTHFIILIDR